MASGSDPKAPEPQGGAIPMKAQLTIPGPQSVTRASAGKGGVALAKIQSRNIVFILEGRSSLIFNPTYPRSGEQEALRQHPLTGRQRSSQWPVCLFLGEKQFTRIEI